jgi:hypothetical protein
MTNPDGFEGPERVPASKIAGHVANVVLCRTLTGFARKWCFIVTTATILLGVIPWIDTNLMGALKLPIF